MKREYRSLPGENEPVSLLQGPETLYYNATRGKHISENGIYSRPEGTTETPFSRPENKKGTSTPVSDKESERGAPSADVKG